MQAGFNSTSKVTFSPQAALTLLLNAIRNNNLSAIDKIVHEDKADVNFCREDGLTPLHCAAGAGNDRAVSMLLAAGANVHALDGEGRSVLRHAMESNKYIGVKKLLEAGADPYHASHVAPSRRLMTDAKYSGTFAMEITNPVRAAAERFAVNQAAHDGDTHWMQSALRGGAPPDTLDRFGKSALVWCCEAGDETGIDSLLAAKADPNFAAKDGNTPLHILAKAGPEKLLEKLCAAGGNLSALNKAGETPLDIALAGGNRAVADYIRRKLAEQDNHLVGTATQLSKPVTAMRKISIVKRAQPNGGL
jgi:ankyrin repeat protein